LPSSSAPKPAPAPGRAVAFVLKGYPRLSETFIAQEIRALEARGLPIRIVSLRRPTDRERHPVHREVAAPVLYLPEYLWREPVRVLRAWLAGRKRSTYRAARAAFAADLKRDPTPNRIRRFGQALVLARELPPEVGALHAHFIHTPASVARYAAILCGLPWSVSAHAKDIWTTPAWETREKLAAASWAVTCTEAGQRHLGNLAPAPDRVTLVHHGLDGERFPASEAARAARNGGDSGDPVRLLSVGRAVPKKGYADLLAALARLPRDLNWRLVHIGGGPLRKSLQRQARRLGIAERIDWRGAQAQQAVLAALREADLFVLASRIAADGDRDGLPNVLVEAASQRLACVASDLPGIAELIEDGVTGRLAPPGDAAGLARAIEALSREPAERARLGAAAEARVRRHFMLERGIDRLAGKFGLAPDTQACALRSTRR
jgi:glycosyltransferase involved in cell wall biosynthesis